MLKRLVAVTIVATLATCILGVTWLIIFPLVDQITCIPNVARKVGVNANFFDVQNYVRDSLKPGMTREDVNNSLSRIAPLSVIRGSKVIGEQVTDQIYLKMCRHPFNNIVIYVRYDLQEKLKSVYIENNDE